MISFTKPLNLNGIELRQELNAGGVAISTEFDSVVIDGEGNLLLDIADKDKTKALSIVAAHNGTNVAVQPTVFEKLASLGLSIDDLKAALGV
jgi:hypothetical protein